MAVSSTTVWEALRSLTRATKILDALERAYPEAHVELNYETPFQLLVATILSAQCTDKRVNMVTPALFSKYPTVYDMAKCRIGTLERLIHSTGFYRNKAKHIRATANIIVNDFNGVVPDTMEQLLTLPGVARKTASCVLGAVYGKNEGVIVDTHMIRLSHRLGFTNAQSPAAIERALMQIVPRERWFEFAKMMVWHGRYTCTAKKPKCGSCPIATMCPSYERLRPK